MAKTSKTINFEENIKNYNESIETIDTFVEAVRKLPGMYIGSKGNIGYLSCIREIFQNSVDECIKKESPCTKVKLSFNEKTQQAVIEDNGRGIPHDNIIRIYTSAHTSSNYTKKKFEYSSGVHGVGSGVALALSEDFEISSYVLGQARRVRFHSGKLISKGEEVIPCPEGRQGTSISMTPDISVLEHVHLTCDDVLNLVLMIFPLMNIGDAVDFYAVDNSGKVKYAENFVNTDGILTHLMNICNTPLINPIRFGEDNGDMKAEIILDYDTSDLENGEEVISFSNFSPTKEHGTHVQGFIDGYCQFFRNYMNKIYLNEKSKITVTNNDIKTGLKVCVNAAHLNPVFAGQFKGKLSNEDMQVFTKTLTLNALDQWTKSNPTDLGKICKLLKDIAEVRMKSEGEKIKISNKFKTNTMTGKPKKYVQPSSNKGKQELIIVEGDSAKGSAKNGRDHTCQGIYPIRGKLPNAFDTPKAKFLANEEVASIITLVGGDYGRNFDIGKVKWDKIIMMCDADPDGSHINTLLLRFFLLYMPGVIEAGKLYRAVPPLYGLKVGKKMKYFTNTIEYVRYFQRVFSSKHEIKYFDTKAKLTTAESTALFVKNKEYKEILETIGATQAVNPKLLEDLLFYYDQYIHFENIAGYSKKKAEKIKVAAKGDGVKSVKAKRTKVAGPDDVIPFGDVTSLRVNYSVGKISASKLQTYLRKLGHRFIKVKDDNGLITINGLDAGAFQDIFMNDKFIQGCMPIIKLIRSNDYHQYILDNQVVSLYQLMTVYSSMQPSNITRYKGLGEQDAVELGDSALRPDSDRTLIRYTMESAKAEIEIMRTIDSNKAVLLKDIHITKDDIE